MIMDTNWNYVFLTTVCRCKRRHSRKAKFYWYGAYDNMHRNIGCGWILSTHNCHNAIFIMRHLQMRPRIWASCRFSDGSSERWSSRTRWNHYNYFISTICLQQNCTELQYFPKEILILIASKVKVWYSSENLIPFACPLCVRQNPSEFRHRIMDSFTVLS